MGDKSNGLDALRAVACAMVVLCHISIIKGDSSFDGLKNGVMLFFALSGYLLYRPFVKGKVELSTYFRHRMTRILPAYVVALVGVSLLTGSRVFFDQPLIYLLFLQNYDPELWQGFLGVSWTLVIEVAFYILLPLISRLIDGRIGRLLIFAEASFIGSVLIMLLLPAPDPKITTSGFPFMLWAFAPGMLVALLGERATALRRWPAPVAGVALLALGTQVWWPSIDLPSGIGSFLLVGWVVTARPSLGRVAPVATTAAALSYSAYLWHVDLIKQYPLPLSLLLIVLVSGGMYLIVERPFIALGRGRRKRDQKADPQAEESQAPNLQPYATTISAQSGPQMAVASTVSNHLERARSISISRDH